MQAAMSSRLQFRWACLWLCLVLLGGVIAESWQTPTFAQEAAEEATADADDGKAATKDNGGTATDDTPEEESVLSWLIVTSGWIGAIILLISFYFVYVVVFSFMTFKLDEASPPELVQALEESLKKRDLATAYKLVKGDTSFLADVLRAGISGLPYGLANAREVMDRTGESNVVQMERQISMLAVIGSLGPMIGLLGTLKGMIGSFGAIARSGTQLDASKVAEGISEALVITFEGVALSVPAIYFFALFKNKLADIASQTMILADDYLLRAHQIQQQFQRPGAAGDQGQA